MEIAVFLDVDNTLTKDFIQRQYAKVLDCVTVYDRLEAQFQAKAIDSTEFGEQIIKLFAARQFTKLKAEQHFKDVDRQPWTDKLLKLPKVHKYLVSSGPSYYIDQLAEFYNIEPENICRTVYTFSAETGIIEGCAAVSSQNKADFVNTRKDKYDITIGVGDSELFDGPFLSHCTIPLMTTKNTNCFQASDFQAVILLIQKLTAALPDEAGHLDPDNWTLPQMWRHMNLKLFGYVALVFGAGYGFAEFIHRVFHI